MKTPISVLVVAAVTLAPLTGSFTASIADIGSQSSPEDTIRVISDETAARIEGALARKWKCAITSFSIGVGLLTIAPAFGGVPAIAAPAFFNGAAFCLI
ncbi:MAG: hypothetical protein OXH70_08015 [Acidobacteria bacterium]|nr:hypothetical protein [Acidobacteriota bacterium]